EYSEVENEVIIQVSDNENTLIQTVKEEHNLGNETDTISLTE
ncbi:702_t:CDS:1, partial [Funneliformis caledonium]